MSSIPKPCHICGRITTAGTFCPQHKPTNAERGYDSAWSATSKRTIRARGSCECRRPGHGHDGRRCASRERLTTDHRVPHRLGGGREPGNLEVLCARCHGFKTAADQRA